MNVDLSCLGRLARAHVLHPLHQRLALRLVASWAPDDATRHKPSFVRRLWPILLREYFFATTWAFLLEMKSSSGPSSPKTQDSCSSLALAWKFRGSRGRSSTGFQTMQFYEGPLNAHSTWLLASPPYLSHSTPPSLPAAEIANQHSTPCLFILRVVCPLNIGSASHTDVNHTTVTMQPLHGLPSGW